MESLPPQRRALVSIYRESLLQVLVFTADDALNLIVTRCDRTFADTMSDDLNRDRELAPLLEHFQERLNLLFSYFFCTIEFEGDEDLRRDPAKSDRAWALQTMQNACLHTTLIALRDLDDFFTPRTPSTKHDDIRASDFGASQSLSFLSASERTDINKHIAHTTVPGAQGQGYRWDIFELTTKAVRQSMTFLEWVEKHLAHHFLVYTAAITGRGKTQAIYKWVTEAVRKQKHDTRNA